MSNPSLGTTIDRRSFLKSSLGAAIFHRVAPLRAPAAPAGFPAMPDAGAIIDVNVSLERWPFRRLRHDEVPHLLEKLRKNGVTEAWVGSFDGLLHKDIASVNSRLAERCESEGQGIFVAFGSINPMWPEWEQDIRRCHETFKMPGIRLHPGYHGYDLRDERFRRLLEMSAERGLVVQLAVVMEDERTQHPRIHAPSVNISPLGEIVPAIPKLKLVLLNAGRGTSRELMTKLCETGRVYFDISWLEGSECVRDLFNDVPIAVGHTLFGSHAPLFYLESSMLKLRESELTLAELQGIASENARRLLQKV